VSWELAVEYRQVALVAREWDEQHLDLRSASDVVAGIGAGAFSGPVRGAVAAFAGHWTRHLTAVALGAERRADGLRTAVEGYLAADEQSALELAAVLGVVGELR